MGENNERNDELNDRLDEIEAIIETDTKPDGRLRDVLLQTIYKATLLVAPEFMARPQRIQFSEN